WQRVLILLAGNLGSLLCAATAVYAALFVPPESALRDALILTAVSVCVLDIGINWMPFINTDGYFILAELLDMPNLQARSLDFIGKGLGRRVAGPEAEFASEEPEPEGSQRFVL